MNQQLRSQSYRIWMAAALLLLMAALIIPRMDEQGLWGDEGWSVAFTDPHSLQKVTENLVEDRHPPLYFLMLRLWRDLTGDDEIAMRTLLLYITLFTGVFLYKLGRVLYGETAGLIILMLYVLSDRQVIFALEVRHYALLLLWIAMSGWALVRWIKKDSRYSALLYVGAVLGGLYTHTFMIPILLGQGLYALVVLHSWRRVGHLIALYGLALLAFLPWLVVTIYQFMDKGAVTPYAPFNWEHIKLLTPQFFGRPVTLTVGLALLGLTAFWMPAPGWKDRQLRWQAVLFPALGFAIPVLFIVGLSQVSDEINLFNDRNLTLLIPAIVILIGLGITAFTGLSRAALITFLLINGLFTTDTAHSDPDWRGIARYIAARSAPGEAVFRDVGGADRALGYHIREEVGRDTPQVSVYDLRLSNQDIYTALRFEKLAGVDSLWWVDWQDELHTSLLEWGYTRTLTIPFEHDGSVIYLYHYDANTIKEEQLEIYGNQMRLHRVAYPETIATGEILPVSLWWSAPQSLPNDYTVSVFLLNEAGQLAAQHDSYPQESAHPTTTWQPDELIFDVHPIHLLETLPPGTYRIGVKVYHWMDGAILSIMSGEDYRIVGQVEIVKP